MSSSSGLDSSIATLRDCVYRILLRAWAEESPPPRGSTPPAPTLPGACRVVVVVVVVEVVEVVGGGGEGGSKGMLELTVLSVELTVDEVMDMELSGKESKDR